MNPLANPAHARDGHAVAEGLVARAVSGQLVAVRDERVAARKSLERFALLYRQSAD